jgi:hypothetical protein
MKQSSKKAAPQKMKAGRGRVWIAVCAGALTLTAVAVIILLNVGKAPAGGESANGSGLTIVNIKNSKGRTAYNVSDLESCRNPLT